MWKYRAVLAVSRPSKSFDPQGSVGSNPTVSAIARRYELFIVRNVFGLTIKIEDRWKTVLYLLFAKKMPPVLPTPRASPENDQTGNFSIFRL